MAEPTISLVDSHCHLDFEDFGGELLDAALDRARVAGIRAVQTIGVEASKFEGIYSIASSRPGVWCSVGLHPHHAVDGIEVSEILRCCSRSRCIGIGETGLDYHYMNSPREVQEEIFRVQLRAARAADVPVIIHTREADEDTIRVVSEESKNEGHAPLRGVFHSFSSGQALLDFGLELGFYFGISGMVTMKWAVQLRKMVEQIPLNRILVETDAPFLAPVPHRGKRNEPSFVRLTAQKVADIKGISLNELAMVTTENFYRLFDKADQTEYL